MLPFRRLPVKGYMCDILSTMSPLLKSIVILHSDIRRAYFKTQEGYETEKNARKDALALSQYAKKLARSVSVIPANQGWVNKITALRPSVVVNLVDSVKGDDTKTPLVCATLEMLGIPFTGNSFKPIAMCYDKFAVKQELQKFDIPTPKGFIVPYSIPIQIPNLFPYPAIVKLNSIHGSVGLSNTNIVHSEEELRSVVQALQKKFASDILVEKYIKGSEISAFVFDTPKGIRVIMSEDILNGGSDAYAIASYEFRWVEENPVIETQMYKNKKIESTMKNAYIRLGMSGYSKFDARVQNGIPYIIDVNPNPAFAPPENDSPFAKTAQSLFYIPFKTLLSTIIHSPLSKK